MTQPIEEPALLVEPAISTDRTGHAIIGRDMCWIEADPPFVALFELPANAIGRSVAETSPDLERVLVPLIRRVFDSGDALTDSDVRAGETGARWLISFYPVRSRNGLVLAVDLVARELPRNPDQASDSQAALPSDISDTLFRRLADVSRTGVLIGERTGRVDYMNPALLKLLGYTQVDLEAGLNWFALTPPEYVERDAQALQTLIETGITTPYEKEYLARDGRRVPVRVSAALLEWQSTGERHAAVFVDDLSSERQAQALLDTLVQKAPIGMAFVDREFRYQQINETLAQLNGKSIQEHLGRTVFELFPKAAPIWVQYWQQILVSGEPIIDLELSYMHHGILQHAMVSYYPVCAGDDAIIGIGIVLVNITERRLLLERERAARAQAEQSQVLLDGLLANAPVGISFFDANLRYLMISNTLAALNGHLPVAHLGRTVEEMAGYGAPVVLPVMQSVLERGVPQVVELSHSSPLQPHQIEHYLVTFYPLRQADGSVIGVGGVRVAITERKRIEERQHYLVEVSRLLADSFDYHTTLNQVAQLIVPDFADWFVVELLDEAQQVELITLANPNPAMVTAAREARKRFPIDLSSNQSTVRVLKTGKAIHWIDINDDVLVEAARDAEELAAMQAMGMCSAMLTPLFIRGEIVGVMSYVSTNPTRHYMHADLVLAEEIARRCAQAIDNAWLFQAARDAVGVRDAFLSTAAHELRTPLTTLLGQAQLAQRRLAQHDTLGERERRPLQIVVEQATRLRRMIGEMLDLSRLETGQFAIASERIDLGNLVAHVIESAQPIFARHQLRAQITTPSPTVVGDTMRLEQVVQNLLSNAAKYSPKASVIDIQVERQGDTARIAIRDYGIGIAADAIPRLFQRFYRAPNAAQQGISGIGVGLYVVREIMALHSGTITVESVEGQGSTFTLMLPIHTQ